MFETNVRNKYDINDELYLYNSKENKIIKFTVFAISLAEKDNEVTYNYRYLEHEVFAVYETFVPEKLIKCAGLTN